eukprot:2450446-Ditylum_brightwellii.AAC.1
MVGQALVSPVRAHVAISVPALFAISASVITPRYSQTKLSFPRVALPGWLEQKASINIASLILCFCDSNALGITTEPLQAERKKWMLPSHVAGT